ncbi:uncharacterized protein PV07_10017 [Cladophialophora immunda]|uniref:Uncharacterized protein n=1 Tax=Cladophialophora immunda TaxID=569365 RepID=A0A0D2C1B9_9EURO|nr:uncharacterized protein PV07_10017 [Cladophialophora immunda]KIW24290.1 hypothetical protein PV07_10017 [Cladophialophora immunda]
MNQTSQAGLVELEAAEREIWREAIEIYNRDCPNHPISLIDHRNGQSAQPPDNIEELVGVAKDLCEQLYAVQNASAKRRAITSALQEIRQYAPILDVFSQGAPSAVSVCWGTIRIVLEVTSRGLSFGQELLNNICAVARRVLTIRQQLQYLIINKQSRDSIVQLYAILLSYATRIARICKSSRWNRVLRGLSSKLPSIYKDFCSLANEVEAQVSTQSAQSLEQLRLVELAHHTQLLLNLDDTKKMLGNGIASVRSDLGFQHDLDARDQQLSKWLTTDLIPHSAPPATAKGTCTWVYEHPKYCAWISSTRTKALCVRGPRGSGKSSLSHAMARSAAEAGQLVIHVSVLPVGTFSQTPASNLVVSLLALISEHRTIRTDKNFLKIRDILIGVQMYGSRTAVAVPTKTLMEKLQSIIALVPPLLLIIDGLDQLKSTADCHQEDYCRQEDSANELVALISGIPTKSSVSLITLTRPRDWISQSMDEVMELDITNDIANNDIAILVGEAARLFPRLEVVKHAIIATIQAKGSGDFNYARMLLSQIQQCRSPANQGRILETSPAGLEAMFRELSAKKVTSLSLEDRAHRSKILYLVAGAQQPLAPCQINSALMLDPARNVEPPGEQQFDPSGAIADLCEPFIIVSDGKVYFQDESAREYVLKFEVTTDDANTFLLDVCLTKLIEQKYMELDCCTHMLEDNLLDPRGTSAPNPPNTTGDPGLYDHATLHWHEYAQQLQYLPSELWEKLRTFLFRNAFVSWAENLYILLGRGGLDPHLQRLVAVAEWYKRSPDVSKPELPIGNLFLQPYRDVSAMLGRRDDRPELQFLPLIRVNGYLNNGGRTRADFEEALQYAQRVVDGFTKYLGPRNRNTLNARLVYYQGILALRRPDEAAVGYQDVLKLQKELLDEDDIDIYVTTRWIGICYQLLTRFDESRAMLEEALAGFKRKQGARSKAVLAVSMGLANTFDCAGNIGKASAAYGDIYDKWVTVNGTSNLFSAWILTSFGSALRKQEQYDRAEELLFEAFATRLRLLTIENDTTVDSGLHLVVLYREKRMRDRALAFLAQIQESQAFELTFERLCQREHLRALLAFDNGEYEEPRNALTRLVMLSTGENREQNNRELLWVRLNLADAARHHHDDHSIPSLFTELVVSTDAEFSADSDCPPDHFGVSPPSPSSEDAVWLDNPRHLEIAEQALRLTRDARPKEARRLLESEKLKWVRDKDFWLFGGGPKADTDTVRYRAPRHVDTDQCACQLGGTGLDNITSP